jgi:integrase
MIERRQEGKRRERVIAPKEWKALLAKACKLATQYPTYSPRSQLPDFLRMAYGTAGRKSDVRRLRWEYIDLNEKLATFHDPKIGTGYTVPLVGDALKAIKAQAKIRREGCPWVFPAVRSDANPPRFDNAWVAVRTAAGVDGLDVRGERLVIHSLRHSAATEAGLGGATAFEVAALTGHKSLANVQRYTHTGPANALVALKKRVRT